MHTQLIVGSELSGLSAILGDISSGVPLQTIVNIVLKNADKFAVQVDTDSPLTDAMEQMTDALTQDMPPVDESPQKLIADLIRQIQTPSKPLTAVLSKDEQVNRLLHA